MLEFYVKICDYSGNLNRFEPKKRSFPTDPSAIRPVHKWFVSVLQGEERSWGHLPVGSQEKAGARRIAPSN